LSILNARDCRKAEIYRKRIAVNHVGGIEREEGRDCTINRFLLTTPKALTQGKKPHMLILRRGGLSQRPEL